MGGDMSGDIDQCACKPHLGSYCLSYPRCFYGVRYQRLDSPAPPSAPPAPPIDEKQYRKQRPVYSGFFSYFPDAIAEVAYVSWIGNEQHNPGEPLHWSRHKSTDQLDASARHTLDHAKGILKDTDGGYHLAKSIWRQLAELQLLLEKERA
jgi:hypothetical protein